MSSALADTTTLTVASAVKGTGNTPTTMLFPVKRSGDLSYDAVLNYHTTDGTAHVGTDYTAASGAIMIPAGATSAAIPIALSPNAGSGGNLTFQLLLDHASGVGPSLGFSGQQSFATGANRLQ